MSISGGTGIFYAQGGMKKWTVHAPGIWTAETDADFIQLEQNCGENGDGLVVTVEENPGLFRQGHVIIRCGEREVSFPVSQAGFWRRRVRQVWAARPSRCPPYLGLGVEQVEPS